MEMAALNLDDIGIADAILEALNGDYDCIAAAMDFSEMGSDERTELHEVRFTSVTLGAGNSIFIEYEYDWSLYHGCRDINASGTEEAHISGTYKNGSFEFPIIPRTQDRSTDEEF